MSIASTLMFIIGSIFLLISDVCMRKSHKILDKAEKIIEQQNDLLDAAIELIAVATMRGDNDLPHPSDDELLWTVRMQDAWIVLEDSIDSTRLEEEVNIMTEQEHARG